MGIFQGEAVPKGVIKGGTGRRGGAGESECTVKKQIFEKRKGSHLSYFS